MLRILMDFALTFASFLQFVMVISLRVFICLYFFTILPKMTFLIACWSSLLLLLLAIFISSEIAFAKRSLFLIGLEITLGLTPASLISESTFLLGVKGSFWISDGDVSGKIEKNLRFPCFLSLNSLIKSLCLTFQALIFTFQFLNFLPFSISRRSLSFLSAFSFLKFGLTNIVQDAFIFPNSVLLRFAVATVALWFIVKLAC